MRSPEPAAELGDLDPQEFRRQGRAVIDWISEYLTAGRQYPVLSGQQPGETLERMPKRGPDRPEAWEETLELLDELVLPGLTHWNHPRFMAYIANTGSAPGILGAALATTLNPNGMLWRTSPVATEMEQRVCDWVRQWLGLPDDTFGIINDTASTSTLCAIAAARQRLPEYSRSQGVAALAGRLRLYRSDQAHSSVDKAAVILGLGLDAVRVIPSRADYTMDPRALRRQLVADRAAGDLPFCVVATAGTTATTSVDPLDSVAEICVAEKLWLHVDAAYAGACAMLEEKRSMFSGWERADSIVVNPHKWLFTPMCSSLLYTRRPEALRDAFSLVPEYLRSDVGDRRHASVGQSPDAPPDYMNYGVQLGRPFRALRLWMVLRAYGRDGIEANLREHLRLAAHLVERIDAHDDFERLAPAPFSIVCFRHNPGVGAGTGDGTQLETVVEDPHCGRNERLLEAVNRSGQAFLSHARLRGRLTLRIAIGNLRTDADDVEAVWRLLQRLAREADA